LGLRPSIAGHADRLTSLLARAADPAGVLGRARDVLEAVADANEPALACLLDHRLDELGRILVTLCGAAPFFVPALTRHPDWVLMLVDEDLAQPRTADEYPRGVRAALAAADAGGAADALRRYKYYELARITVRALSDDFVPPEQVGVTLFELSRLADALLDGALTVAAERAEARYGAPIWSMGGQSQRLGFTILGLGKLGAEALNYSSDVDLIYAYDDGIAAGPDETPPARGPADLTPAEYFTRLAQDLGRLVGESTAEGFLYRIDLDLRPDGKKGPLVVSGTMLAEYHEHWAATWERAVYMKARPVAGDLAFGWRIIRGLAPMIYRSTMDLETVAAVKDLRDRTERETLRPGDPFDVKIGSGGIRDIESVAQALQLLHGGRIPEVRARGTEAALLALGQVGVLPPADVEPLLGAYRFLRRTENLLQMVGERQTHQLPRAPEELARLGRAHGFVDGDPVAAFEAALDHHRATVQHIAAAFFHRGGVEQILDIFGRRIPRLLANPVTRGVLEELAEGFAREIAASANPQRAINNLDRFVEGVGVYGFYYQLLHDRPELVARLTTLFAASEYLSGYFARQPRLIEPIFEDPNVLLIPRDEIARNFTAVRNDLLTGGDHGDADLELEALRLAQHREILNVGLLDLDEKVTRAAVEGALSDIAEVCLARGLALAHAELERHAAALPAAARAIEFLVVGMGKLASRELTYGSDLDVIFLYGDADEDLLLAAQGYFVRLAQKLIWALATRTAAGFCYDIDARLRPSGNQGMLVTSLRSFAHYHASSAQVWERQALLRARPVAGGERLGAAFDRQRRQILGAPLPPDLGTEVHRIRVRMETEIGRETRRRHDFKTGRGGMQDVETVIQYLQLRHGRDHAALFDAAPVATHLARLEHLSLLAPDDARPLGEGWAFLERLSARLRIVDNRSISDLDEERGDLDALARTLGYAPGERAGSARRRLLDDYRRHTDAIRATYRRVLGLAGD
jgi:glutamate-ammonia-ligase adenylyltransferase